MNDQPPAMVFGKAANGNECAEMLAKFKPDIQLLDLRMSEKDGLSVLEEINFGSLTTRVIVLAAAEGNRDIIGAMSLGARGVVLKQSASDLFLRSLSNQSFERRVGGRYG